jgi:hypothetical protein
MNQKLPVPESHRDKPFVVKHEIRALADPWLGSHPAAVEYQNRRNHHQKP